MRVIPERAGRVIGGHIVFILEVDAGIDRDQDVIAVAGGIDPQTMGMHIGAIEAVRRIDPGGLVGAAGVRGQAVAQPMIYDQAIASGEADCRP